MSTFLTDANLVVLCATVIAEQLVITIFYLLIFSLFTVALDRLKYVVHRIISADF